MDYRDLGISPIVSAQANSTPLGGCTLSEGVIAAMGGIWGGSGMGKGGGSVNYCAVSVEEASLAHGKPLTRKPCTGCDGGV